MSYFNIDQNLSLVIPRVFPQWVDEQKIVDIFHQQCIGWIYKVSIVRVPDEPGRNYPIYKAYLYFSVWYDNEIAYNIQQRIFGVKRQARVVYDDPWYWTIYENQHQRLSKYEKRHIRDTRKTVSTLSQLAFQIEEINWKLNHHQHRLQEGSGSSGGGETEATTTTMPEWGYDAPPHKDEEYNANRAFDALHEETALFSARATAINSAEFVLNNEWY